jgi:hypothetical protein
LYHAVDAIVEFFRKWAYVQQAHIKKFISSIAKEVEPPEVSTSVNSTKCASLNNNLEQINSLITPSIGKIYQFYLTAMGITG